MNLRCDNCGRTCADERKLACVFPDIPDLCTRIEPGGIVPHGECPYCGCLVYNEPESEPEMLRCLVCGDRVDVNGFRDHLESHHPNAAGMDWEDVQAQFVQDTSVFSAAGMDAIRPRSAPDPMAVLADIVAAHDNWRDCSDMREALSVWSDSVKKARRLLARLKLKHRRHRTMSDRYSARIEIGGELPRQHLPRFCRLFDVDGEEGLSEHIADGHLVQEDDQAAWGEFFELETACRDLDLPYRRHSEGYWDQPPQLVFWQPGMEEPESVTTNGDGDMLASMVTLREARDLMKAGSAAEALALLEETTIEVPVLPEFRLM